MLNRDRVRKFRLLKKGKHNQSLNKDLSSPYRTPQALGKAVSKVKKLLPNSPRKRKAVVMKLANTSGVSITKKYAQAGNKGLPSETIKLVNDFFLLDSVSRQAPGRRDFVTVRHDGEKKRIQKRHLLWSLRETFAIFQKENPSVQVGLSKFCSLRPINVMLSAEMPRDVCLCQYHENIKMICDCLHKEIASFPQYSGNFVNNFVCNSGSELCMLGKCNKCPNWIEAVKEEANLAEPTLWYQWERVEQTVPGKKGKCNRKIKKMQKVCKVGTVEDTLRSLEDKLPFFLEHVFIKRKQAEYFEEKLKHLTTEEAVIQVDFSENYACKYQDEIQTAHWNAQQVSLFPVAIWTRSTNGEVSCDSHVIVSDELVHDKKAVAVFMDMVIHKFIKERHQQVTCVHIFSDGPSSQFKNRYVAHFLHTLRQTVNLQWHFFATAHGKGAVDGIGGTVKRVVWKAVSTRKVAAVKDAKSFADVATKFCKSVNVSFVNCEKLNATASSLCLNKYFMTAPVLPGISKLHCMEPQKNGSIRCRFYSYQSTFIDKGVHFTDADSDSQVEDDSTGYSDIDEYEGEWVPEDDERSEGNEEQSDDNEEQSDDNEEESDDNEEESDDNEEESDDNKEESYDNKEESEDNEEENDDSEEESEDNEGESDDSEEDKEESKKEKGKSMIEETDEDDDKDVYMYESTSRIHIPKEPKSSATPKIKVQHGLPDEFLSLFKGHNQFSMPHHLMSQVNAILDGVITFEGANLITNDDLTALSGSARHSRGKWVSNFIVDEYLCLIKSACANKSVKVETLSWEIFEKAVGTVPVKAYLNGKDSLLLQDAVLVPCNKTKNEHWSLMAVLPKKKCVLFLDSKAGDFVKPTTQKALAKMGSLLKELECSLDLDQWTFIANKQDDIPQQSNTYDCGVFTCLYARCLVGHSKMIDEVDIPAFRKFMLFDLHESVLHPVPSEGIQLEKYYAVGYTTNYYIGRAISQANNLIVFKFLHRIGANQFNWPRRDDVDEVHDSCIFYGPVSLENTGPFIVQKQKEIEKIFAALKKQSKNR